MFGATDFPAYIDTPLIVTLLKIPKPFHIKDHLVKYLLRVLE